ncbi:MAG: methyltransferase [Chloroflexales bacterium]|nr:methyltransferase [Chloroflexales bacterium]
MTTKRSGATPLRAEPGSPPVDPYFKKRIPYSCRGQAFSFDVAHTLFASFEVDDGTDLLLRTIDVPPPATLLDIGCGAGVIGVVLGRLFPAADVTMIDVNLLAVRYARHNAAINGVERATVLGSVGLEQAPQGPFDLIVSNIPAKIGDEAIEQEFVLAPLERLRRGGDYWFVVVSGLNRLIPGIGVRHGLKLKEAKKRSGYTVYHIRRPL